ncbi:hypothetical protein [Humidisolicoccus flavus]|uniref:hypothetical protein n=1 Tax=Humidisolicoccus flavus TaxID=3111414 RepID=UPI0032459363
MSIIDEDTLGRRIGHIEDESPDHYPLVAETTQLTAPLRRGIAALGACLVLGALTRWVISESANPVLQGCSWVIVLVVLSYTLATAWRGTVLPVLPALLAVLALCAAFALDWIAVVSTSVPLEFLGPGIGAMLALSALTSIAPGYLCIAAACAGAGAIALLPWSNNTVIDTTILWSAGIVAVAFIPTLAMISLSSAFAKVARQTLDRELSQRSIAEGGFLLGQAASSRLAKLDTDAEQLLARVGSGAEPLPLRPAQAEHAAQLATEFRLYLLASRMETWLHSAIRESPSLGKVVTLTDPSSLAVQLPQLAREGLLRAMWLVIEDRRQPHLTVALRAPEEGERCIAVVTLTLSEPLANPRPLRGVLARLGNVTERSIRSFEVTVA